MNECVASYLVYPGAAGWEYPAWRGRFYPDELPDDWMLAFYNTQFRALWLPQPVWMAATDDEIGRWVEDTQCGFRFVLETAAGGEDAGRTCAAKLAGRGIVATPEWSAAHVVWLDAGFDARALAARIGEQAAQGQALFLISREGDLAVLERARELTAIMGY
jgi:hypothetical protein